MLRPKFFCSTPVFCTAQVSSSSNSEGSRLECQLGQGLTGLTAAGA